jgi:outer membrane protein assembly factor BamB/HEAT repeat protein
MAVIKKPALAMMLAVGLSQAVALSQSPVSQPQPSLSTSPAAVRDWANRLLGDDPKVRATAEAALVRGARRSVPLLKRFLAPEHEDLHVVTFEIIQRIGPPAIPLLVELLRHERVSIRRTAVDELIDLAPHTEWIQPALRRALSDEDSTVAGDAARALGALGKSATPSVGALVETLSHPDPYVRIYAAEALASIGPNAAGATNALAQALGDPVPGVRWAACEALASIGPAAQSAVPQLIEALEDEFLYVRIFAAGALGSIRPKAQSAREALTAAANDPALRDEAEWALNRIAGRHPIDGANERQRVSLASGAGRRAPAPRQARDALSTSKGASEPVGESEGRSPSVKPMSNPPVDWDTTTGRNIVWSVELGNEAFGRPVVAGDAVYVGTDNARHLNPDYQEEAGVLVAFHARDGKFLWQDVAPRVERGLREFLLPSTTSAPYVEGNRLYYVTAECQLRCLDTRGFRDGENNGPYQDELFQDGAAADIVWELDICGRLGVFPHEATNSEVLPVGDLLMVSTSNGRNEGHTRVPSPRAPSLIAVDKRSGDVVWRAIGAGEQVLHGQWSSPVAANVNGRIQVLFGGGDGWLRSYDAASGHEVWRFDGNPKDARWLPRPGVLSRGSIIASPVFADGRVFVAMGQSPGHGNGPSLIHAISPNGQGDVTESRRLWTSREVGRVVGTPVAKDGLLYVGDLGGTIHCLDAATGAHIWRHQTNEAIWGSLVLAGDRLYVGNVEGSMIVLRAGRDKQVLAQIEMDAPLYTPPALLGDALYLATAARLYLIASKAGSQP